jgi:ribosomal-protein-alanine N-acetyltransferase
LREESLLILGMRPERFFASLRMTIDEPLMQAGERARLTNTSQRSLSFPMQVFPMQLTLRSYSPGDFETLYSIDQDCYPRGIAYSRRTLKSFLGASGADCVIARAQQGTRVSIVGFIITEERGAEGRIITLDVVREHRRSGVGTALLREAERRMDGRGVRRVSLETATSNEAGVAFWQRHGYRGTGVLRGYYLGRIDAYVMLKDLAHPQE